MISRRPTATHIRLWAFARTRAKASRAHGASPMSKQKPNSRKKQHFVPQCYTKAWWDPASVGKLKVDPYVWVFDPDESNPRRRSWSNLFTETDIYTMRSPDGSSDLRLKG